MLTKFYTKLFAFFICTFFLYVPVSRAQETEPNNTPAQANVILLNGSENGSVSPAGDIDWYQVTTTGDGQLNLTLDNTGNQDLKSLSLYDQDGITLITNANVGNGVGGLQKDGLAAGIFYIKINGSSGTETGAYILSAALIVPAQGNDAEPNNVFSQAGVLGLNDSTHGHIGYYHNGITDTTDWYKVTTTSDGMLQFLYNNTGHQDIKTISLYDNDGVTLLTSAGVGNGIGGLQKDALAAGTYYVKINGASGNEFGAYTLSDTLITLAQGNDPEPNNIYSQASVLGLNDSTHGHIGYYYNGATDTTDWYKVTTVADGTLKLYYDNTGHQDLKVVSLYDNNGVTLLNTTQVGNGFGEFNTDGLAAGTYYVKINGASGNEFGAYTLADTLITPARANDNEPNDNFSLAEILAINDSTTGHIGYYYNNRRDTSDYYRINISSRGVLSLLLDNTGNPNLNMNLYDASGTNQIGGVTVGSGKGGLQTDTLAPGVYYVQITGAGGNNSQFGPYALSDSLFSALPVTLINFAGRLADGQVILSWNTASEMNNKGFVIEKNTGGQGFLEIGFVAGKGNSSVVNSYHFDDIKVLSGSNYYRLKQIDIDNKFTYSSIIKINYSKFHWTVVGNPVSGNSYIQLQLDKPMPVSIQIFSIDGKMVQSMDQGNLSAGTYSIPLNLNDVKRGVYVIKLLAGDRFYTKKVSK